MQSTAQDSSPQYSQAPTLVNFALTIFSHSTLPTTCPLAKASPNTATTNHYHTSPSAKLTPLTCPAHKLQRHQTRSLPQAPTLARPSGWLAKENFYLFFISRLDKSAFFGYCLHFNCQQYEKSLKNFKIFSVTVVLCGAGQMGS